MFASKVASLPTPRDALHHAFSWDVSQNVHMAQPNSRPGITGCLTPGGYIFLPCMSRCLTGAEKLLFNGIPVDRLQIGQETEVQLSDLAGNAMSLTVVSACTLAALCVKEYARRRIKDNSFRLGTYSSVLFERFCSRILIISTLLLTSLEHHSNTNTQTQKHRYRPDQISRLLYIHHGGQHQDNKEERVECNRYVSKTS